jgi:CheY-like chemotaxis protein
MNYLVSDRIWIIDTDELYAKIIQRQLEYTGLSHIEVFTDPEAAIGMAKTSILAPAVVITEFALSNMTGIRLLNEIKRYQATVKGFIVTSDPACVPQDVRYPVYSRTSRKIMNGFEDIVDVFRGVIRTLCVKCPMNRNRPLCPFFAIRELTKAQKIAGLLNMDARAAQRMVRLHQTCLERQQESCNPAD